jgi:hypothetical protein
MSHKDNALFELQREEAIQDARSERGQSKSTFHTNRRAAPQVQNTRTGSPQKSD